VRILVTGCNGLLGQKLASLLSAKDSIKLILTAKNALSYPTNGVEFHLLDITSKTNVDTVVGSTQPDVIINTAAMTQVDPCELDQAACRNANVTGVENLISASQRHSVHLIHVSTDFIFDGTRELLDESAQPNPVNYYGACKLEGERLVTSSTISWCIIRTVLVYGVTHGAGRSNIVLWVKNSLEAGKTIQVVSDQWRTPTLAEDLAAGCYLAALRKARGIYHISGKDFLSIYDIALRTADYFKLDKSLIKATNSSAFTQPGRRPLKTGFIIDKARHDLGYEPHSLDEGIAIVAGQLPVVPS